MRSSEYGLQLDLLACFLGFCSANSKANLTVLEK